MSLYETIWRSQVTQDEKSSSPFIHILEDFINIDFVLYLLSYRLKNIRNRSCLVQRHPVKIENRVNIHSYKLNILQGCSSWFLEFFWNRKVNQKQHLHGGLGQPVSTINYKRTWSELIDPPKKIVYLSIPELSEKTATTLTLIF